MSKINLQRGKLTVIVILCYLLTDTAAADRVWRVGDCHIMDPVVFARSEH